MVRPPHLATNTEENEHLLMLPSKEKAGEKRRISLWNTLKFIIPANNTYTIIYTGLKLASKFNIKNEMSGKHKYDLIYKVQCPDLNCDMTYKGEVEGGFPECVIDRPRRDDKSLVWTRRKDRK